MKKRLTSCVLALVFALGLVTGPATAVIFPDTDSHWARDDIARMADRGLFKGYEDGSFRPDHLMLTSEALALCARIAAGDALREQIGEARAEELDTLLGTNLSWFRNDFAACLEFGILTYSELEKILRAGQDQVPMQKAEFARYLTRAMGLEELASGMDAVSLTYADAATVPAALQPYIYILTIHGVVNGTPENEIQPLSFLNRAVAATMIGRVLEAMESLKINVELPRYTTHDWVAGYITAVADGTGGTTLISVDGIMGAHTVALKEEGAVYQYNMPVKRTELKTGAYIRLALDASGRATAGRLITTDRLSTGSGMLAGLDADQIDLNTESYAINRFTVFSAGGTTGDWSSVDLDAGYTEAECIVDDRGVAVFVTLQGGTRETFGLLSAVEVNQTTGAISISVSGYDGRVKRYALPSDVPVTSAGLPLTLRAGEHVGVHVTLRVMDEDESVVTAVALDLLSKYIQGALNSINAIDRTANITELPGSRNGTYPIATGCSVAYNGASVALSAVKSGSYVTARVQGGEIVALSVWPGEVETKGKLVSITYADDTILNVLTENGVTEQFSVSLSDLSGIRITRGNATTDISALSTGDTVTIVVRFHQIISISAAAQAANVTGTVEEISFNASGATITLKLPDGSLAVYTATSGVTVIQDGNVVQLTDIKPGATLAAVTEGTRIISAEIKETAVSNTELEGVIYIRESSGRRLTLKVSDGAGGTRLVVVNIPYSVTTVSDTVEGSISLAKLEVGDYLRLWGTYNKQEFDATVVVRVR